MVGAFVAIGNAIAPPIRIVDAQERNPWWLEPIFATPTPRPSGTPAATPAAIALHSPTPICNTCCTDPDTDAQSDVFDPTPTAPLASP